MEPDPSRLRTRVGAELIGSRLGLRLLSTLLVLLGLACVDTALGLVVNINSGAVGVVDETIHVAAECSVRVGEHALGGDDYYLPTASIFVGDTPIAEVHLERTGDLVTRLEPGESTTFRVVGSVPEAGFPNARALLCGETKATLLVQWVTEQQPDDPLDPPVRSVGTAEGLVDVACD